MDYIDVITDASTGKTTTRFLTEDEIKVLTALPSKAVQQASRNKAYVVEADPLFFMAQRGEATLEDWQSKVDEIKARYPYPEEVK